MAGNAGRRFAGPSGDWNPIHVSAVTARLFGYPRAIGHGMFSAARCVDLLCRDLPACAPLHLDLRFKRPLLIPGEVALHTRQEAESIRFVFERAATRRAAYRRRAAQAVRHRHHPAHRLPATND